MTRPRTRLERLLASSLIDPVERDHSESDEQFRRRRVVAAVTLVVGAVLLGISLSLRPGASSFYLLTAAVAATWTLGGLLSGPLHLGYLPVRGRLRRPLVTPLVTGLAAAALFVLGALVVRQIPALRDYVESVLAHARRGAVLPILLVTVVNGVSEEIFFRGGLYAAIGRRYPVVLSTAVYALATVATTNPMLVFAAATLGFVLGLQRRVTGGILAPAITHVTWSTVMLFALPPLFAG